MKFIQKAWCRTFQTGFYIALPLLPYRNPKVRKSINDIPEILQSEGISRVLVVSDMGLVKAGIVGRVEEVLRKASITYEVFSDTVANPTINNVEAARAQYLRMNAEGLIAIGGGSAMDCAKATGARIAKPNQTIPQMRGILRIHKRLPLLIAIPTTAGTGSETTLAAVITDSEKQYKYPINDFPLIPRYAVLDWSLTTGLPQHITATTGMDALVHAVEAYIGNSTTRETRAMSEHAVKLIHDNLYNAYLNGNDQTARSNMLEAAYCAGIAFSKSYVGYVHAVAHSLGGKYGTPHGLANAVLLPKVLKMYGSHIYKKLARLSRITGVVENGLSDEETAKRFIDWTLEMNNKMGIPDYIDELREEDIDEMSAHADAEGNPLYPVPLLMDQEELKQIYRAAIKK